MHTRSAAHLELVPATEGGIGPTTQHARSTSTSALALLASFAMLVAVGYVGALGAILAVGVLVGICFSTMRMRGVQHFLERQAKRGERNRLERSRQRQLPRAAPLRQAQYRELRALADGIESADRREAERFGLDELLDYFVRLSIGHQRCAEAMRIAGDVVQRTPAAQPAPTTRRHEIADRRLRHHEECAFRLEKIADEIAATDELIRLVAQRVACASLDPVIDREIEVRLAELDGIDEALSQVSA